MSDGVLHVGQVVADRFVVESILGIGGLAEVYKVRHRELGSLHAIKVLTIRRKGMDDRLRQEGRIQAQLRHPNVVAVNDIVMLDEQPVLVMEFVDGPTLEDLLRQRGKFPVDEALALMTPVLAAVANAHAHSAVHRDLKPANVLLQRTNTGYIPKVADFGIGKLLDSPTIEGNPRQSDTRAGMAMGTPGYISPEQVRDSSSVDARTDVFALGVMVYQLIAGRLPYANPDGNTDITSTLVRDLVPLTSLEPEVPPAIAEAIRLAVAKEPEDRTVSVMELARGLGVAASPSFIEPSSAGPVSRLPDAERSRSGETSTAPKSAPSSQNPSRPPPPAVRKGFSTGALVVLVALPLAAVAVLFAGALAVGMGWLAMFEGDEVAVVPPEPTEVAPDRVEVPAPTDPAPGVAPTEVAPEPGAPRPSPTAAPQVPGPQPQVPGPSPTSPDPAPVEPAPVEVVPAPVEPAPQVPSPVAPDPVAPDPVAPDPVAPAPASVSFVADGRWAGNANGRPLTLTVTAAGSSASGSMLFPPNRTVKLNGTFDPKTGALNLMSADGIRVDAKVLGSGLVGSYSMGGAKPVPFSLAR